MHQKKRKRRRVDQHLKTLCPGLSRAGLNHQPISVSIYKVWTNQKSDIPALSFSKSDSLASFQYNVPISPIQTFFNLRNGGFVVFTLMMLKKIPSINDDEKF